MKYIIHAAVALALGILLTGCSTFYTIQTDTSYEAVTNGTKIVFAPVRTIKTKAKARTFFDARSQLANFKATQSDKTQGASVGSLSQETSGTNAVTVAERAAFGFAQGLKK